MSIDVCIKQKGLFKKTIPLDVIVGDELAFGINDGMRMVGDDQEGKMIFLLSIIALLKKYQKRL